MRYLSVCSGIEAASVAWEHLGWTPVGFSEIEPFPCAVLKHRFPNVTNFGDMTKYKEWPIEAGSVDLLVGGSPCQSFSLAGLRKGLEDPRGQLMLVFLGIADHFRIPWLLWENVPGVLSSNGGRDFGTFLGALAELGYEFSWRVLDAVHFGVPQRRRRVFLAASLRDRPHPAQVLFEQSSFGGDFKKGSASRQKATRSPSGSVGSGSPQQDASKPLGFFDRQAIGAYGQADAASTLNARDYKSAADLVTTGPWWNGSDIADTITRTSDDQRMPDKNRMQIVVTQNEVAGPLDAHYGKGPGSRAGGEREYIAHVSVMQPVAVASDIVPALTASGRGVERTGDSRGQDPVVAYPNESIVRRLLPVECEKLQGFPPGWTEIPWKGKPAESCPDGPRYKALGNSFAVPVVRWIGERLDAVTRGKA